MGFIYGIVNFDVAKAQLHDFEKLSGAMKSDSFDHQVFSGDFYSIGYCWNSQRGANAEIIKFRHLTIIADIRLYKVERLKQELEFTTPADAFLKAYLKWGLACANHLNGDFSVAVIDEQQKEVHLIRDHIGARPLAYYFNGKQLVFASHEFGLAKSGLIPLNLSETTAISRLFNMKSCYTLTVFDRIYKLTPGHFVSFSSNKKEVSKYWRPENIRINKSLTLEQTISNLRTLLVESTLSRITLGRVGVHVSGGLDSTGVACILADYIDHKSRITGYSWTPGHFVEKTIDQLDEKPFIEDFVKEKEIPVRYVQEQEEFERVKNSILPDFENQHIEHPTMKMAREDGVSILFSGWGGDEFSSLALRGTFGHLFFRLKWMSLCRFVRQIGIRSSMTQFRREILPLIIPFGLLSAYQPFRWSNIRYFRNNTNVAFLRKVLFHKRERCFSVKGRRQLMLNLLSLYHITQRTDSWAINAEKYGFEYRYPLLDKDLLEFWFSIPIEYTFHDFKSRPLYREALRNILTESIRVRTEKGEALRISHTRQKDREGFKYITGLLKELPQEQEVSSLFKHDVFCKMIDEFEGKKNRTMLDEIHAFRDSTIYLRYINLYQEYFLNTRKEECESATF